MTAHRERVDKLIALALDDAASENERRNASLQAVKLIDKHGMLDDHEELEEHKQEIEDLQKQVRDLRAALGTIGQVARTFVRTWSAVVVPVPTQEDVNFMRRNKAWSVGSARVVGRSCPECGLPITAGELIATPRGVGEALHFRCYQKREKEKGR